MWINFSYEQSSVGKTAVCFRNLKYLVLLKLKSIFNQKNFNCSRNPNTDNKSELNRNLKNIKNQFWEIKENQIFINNKEISSEILIFMSRNFSVFENFREILLIHACYFFKLFFVSEKELKISVFLRLLKNVFSINPVNLSNNGFIQSSLIGLFNAF